MIPHVERQLAIALAYQMLAESRALRRRRASDPRLGVYTAVRVAEAGRLRRHAATLPRRPGGRRTRVDLVKPPPMQEWELAPTA